MELFDNFLGSGYLLYQLIDKVLLAIAVTVGILVALAIRDRRRHVKRISYSTIGVSRKFLGATIPTSISLASGYSIMYSRKAGPTAHVYLIVLC